MPSDKMIYICGDFASGKVEDVNLKSQVLGSVATLFCVRSHPIVHSIDARFDTADLYHTITRCHVFVFIFSKETIDDTFYLNQYGIAKAYGIPVIGVREPSYFMPNPLPEQFYFTEIVDYTGENRAGTSNRAIHGPNKHPTLAEDLVQDFKTAMVYASEFHKSCAARLLHKVTQACNRSENEKKFYAEHHQRPATRENFSRNTTSIKCPKCGFSFSKQPLKPRPLVRASSTGSLWRKSDSFEYDSPQQKQNKKTTLQPTTIQIPCPNYMKTQTERIVRSPIGNWARKGQKPIQPFKGKLQSRTSQLERDDNIVHEEKQPEPENITERIMLGKESGEELSAVNNSRMLRKQSRVTNTTWSDKLRMKLRRQSSLPVIPTTYLVTSPIGIDKQLSFVKYPPENSLNSPRHSLLPVFSEDEEQEIIHISRAPSPDSSSW